MARKARLNSKGARQMIRAAEGDLLTDRLFEIEFLDPGVETFAFTFGGRISGPLSEGDVK
jgi:hypothetical protein